MSDTRAELRDVLDARARLDLMRENDALKSKLAQAQADVEALRQLKEQVELLPCLGKATENGKGIAPVPEWVIFEIAKALADLPEHLKGTADE